MSPSVRGDDQYHRVTRVLTDLHRRIDTEGDLVCVLRACIKIIDVFRLNHLTMSSCRVLLILRRKIRLATLLAKSADCLARVHFGQQNVAGWSVPNLGTDTQRRAFLRDQWQVDV